jgi:hypothetical protein
LSVARVRRDASWLAHAPLRTFSDCIASRRSIRERHARQDILDLIGWNVGNWHS